MAVSRCAYLDELYVARENRFRHTKLKRIARIGIPALICSGILAAGVYFLVTKDPTPIKLDARLYDDYAGYYGFPNGYPVAIRREGDRLLTITPGHAPTELFPETETQFFIRGNPARWIFHRDENGRLIYAISRWKKIEEKAEKRFALPTNPEGTNGRAHRLGPRLHGRSAGSFVGWGAGQVEANTFDPKVLDGLKQMGLKIEVVSARQAAISRGYWAGIQIDPHSGRMKGGVSRGVNGEVGTY